MNAEAIVRKIHELGRHKAVLAITGGGAESIGELLRHGNGSKTLLEAVVPYDQAAFDAFVQGKPDKYCSPGAARDLAMAAYMRAVKLTGSHDNVVGVGASCSLVKDGGERAGRQHLVYVAYQNKTHTGTLEFEIDHETSAWTREQEETFASEKILNALVEGMQLSLPPLPESLPVKWRLPYSVEGTADEQMLVQEKTLALQISVNPGMRYGLSKYVLCGSFNPCHESHLRMAQVVYETKGEPVHFEMCVRNADKPPMNYYDIRSRFGTLEAHLKGQPWAGNIHLTTLPRIIDKARFFPRATFIVGFDTLTRIADPKYYGGHLGLEEMAARLDELKCRFLVFHRMVDGRPSRLEDLAVLPESIRRLVEVVPETIFPANDISSTQIRGR